MGQRTSPLEGVERLMKYIDFNFFRGKRVFVTGHTGFKGSWLCQVLVNAGAEVTGYSLPAPTEPSLFALTGLESRMKSITGDIRDLSKLREVYDRSNSEVVLHLAAQPIVRTSYEQPVYTYEANVMGTVNLLECIRTAGAPPRSVVIITTDKVYENKEWAWGYRENDPLDGYDPYSNSKSCAELAVHSYVNSFFKNSSTAVSTARAGNVIGGGDFARDRIIPDCIRAAQAGEPVIVRNPYSTRPYQHVLEPVIAYLMIAQRQCENPGLAGWYNVGPDDSDCVATGELVETFCRAWGEGMTWENRAEVNAPHEAGFLKLDCSKLKSTFGWRPRWNIQEAVEQTVIWTKTWMARKSIPEVMDEQINAFLQEGYHGKVEQ